MTKKVSNFIKWKVHYFFPFEESVADAWA